MKLKTDRISPGLRADSTLKLRTRAVLMGTSALLFAALPQGALRAEEAMLLEPITVEQNQEGTRALETSDEGAGSTYIDAEGVQIRSDGSGDANTALTTLPHVQASRTALNDGGTNTDDVLDLKPLELSISGASVTENTILLNGVNIDSITGNSNPTTSTELNREDGTPNMYGFYGLHSQTQFIPTAFVESVEALDSNVSARYGGFQGGVIKYQLKEPSLLRPEGSFTLNYGTHDWTSYLLGTEDGQNPYDQPKPEWTKLEYAFDYNQPLTDHSALRFGFSRREAEASKAMDAQYVNQMAENSSTSDFYTLSYLHELQDGSTLTFSGYLTDYSQGWDSNYADGFHLDVETRSISLDAKYEKSWDQLSIAGLDMSNAKLTVRAIHQDNEASNQNDKNVYYNWYANYPYGSNPFSTNAFASWCDASSISSSTLVACRTGGYGDSSFEDTSNRIEAILEAEIARGRFAVGAGIERIEAKRTKEEFTYYSTTTRQTSGGVSFVCATGDDTCMSDQYFNRRIWVPGYDVSIDAWQADLYGELEQTWGDFTLLAGLRVDYNDVLKNLDIAPRLTGTWKPNDAFSLSLGANRYYSDSYLATMIKNGVNRGLNQTRTHDSTTGVVGDWTTYLDLGEYSFNQGALDTPYTDELALEMLYRDDWTGGVWRLSGIYRDGKDQFQNSLSSTSTNVDITNEGWSRYRSVGLEYEKNWDMNWGALDKLGLYASAVWAESRTSVGVSEDSLDFISYHSQSYSSDEFKGVTGNLDIPVRSTLELRSSWKQDRIGVGLGADITFAYDGVRDSGSNETLVHPIYGSTTHDIYEDHRFGTAVAAFLSLRFRLAETRNGAVDLNIKVANLFDDAGNNSSTDDNPWVEGRSISFGTSITW